jgi:DNA-binding CsgD family transcriptional regulator
MHIHSLPSHCLATADGIVEGHTLKRTIRLTRREREIVLAILDGCTNREMSQRFGISEQTVKNQLSTLYAKVGVSSRLELAVWAQRRLGD